MTGEPLSKLLKILRNAGVTRYQTPELTLELGPAPAKGAPLTLNVSPEAVAAAAIADAEADEGPPDGDFRFALERMTEKHFPRTPIDPRKAKQ